MSSRIQAQFSSTAKTVSAQQSAQQHKQTESQTGMISRGISSRINKHENVGTRTEKSKGSPEIKSSETQGAKSGPSEANYGLIRMLASALNRHLKKQEVIGEASKGFTIDCVDEIIHICEICIKREAKKKAKEGKSLIKSKDQQAISQNSHEAELNPKETPVTIVRSNSSHRVEDIRSMGSGVMKSPIHISEKLEIPQSHLLTLNGLRSQPQCMQNSHSFSNLCKFQCLDASHNNHSHGGITVLEEITLKGGRSTLENSGKNAHIKIHSSASANPMTTVDFQKAPRREEPPSIRGWQWRMPLSNFELCLPCSIIYPNEEYLSASSPVFFHECSLRHTKAIAVWKNLSLKNSQELYCWDKIFYETLAMTLNYLRIETGKENENCSLKAATFNALHGHVFEEYPKVYWSEYEWPQSYFMDQMKILYKQKYGQPQYLVTDTQLLCYLATRDTICSMSATSSKNPNESRLWDSNNEPTTMIKASVGFTSTMQNLDIRRFMPLICVRGDSKSHIAVAGQEFVLTPCLWDPHHPYCDLEGTTTYTLDPNIHWLTWNHTQKAFVGVPPCNIIRVMKEDPKGSTAEKWVDNTADEYLELTLVAFNFLSLPEGVVYERTIKAFTTIQIKPSLQAWEIESSNNDQELPQNQTKFSKEMDCPKDIYPPNKIQTDLDYTTPEVLQTPKTDDGVYEYHDYNNIGTETIVEACASRAAKDQEFVLAPETVLVTQGTICDIIDDKQDEIIQAITEETAVGINLHSIREAGDKFDVRSTDLIPLAYEPSQKHEVQDVMPRPAFSHPTWASQRAYIEQKVNIRGKRMMGLFRRGNVLNSDSSETELSDDESRFLKNIPFVTNDQPSVWKATVSEPELQFGDLGIPLEKRPGRELPLNSVKPVNNAVPKAVDEVEKTTHMRRMFENPQHKSNLVHDKRLAGSPESISATSSMAQHNKTSTLRVSIKDEDGDFLCTNQESHSKIGDIDSDVQRSNFNEHIKELVPSNDDVESAGGSDGSDGLSNSFECTSSEDGDRLTSSQLFCNILTATEPWSPID